MTHRTLILGYGPQDGQVGQRLTSEPYCELGDVIDAKHSRTNIRLEVIRHVTSTQQQEDIGQFFNLDDLDKATRDLAAQVDDKIETFVETRLLKDSPSDHQPSSGHEGTPTVDDHATDPIKYITVRTI